MWQIINVEPTYGVCSLCRSHECGIVDGKHQWIHTEALDDSRENIVIGYKCVKLFAENLGISKTVIERVVHSPHPSTVQLLSEAFTKLKEYEDSINSSSELKFNGADPNVIVSADAPGTIQYATKQEIENITRGKKKNSK